MSRSGGGCPQPALDCPCGAITYPRCSGGACGTCGATPSAWPVIRLRRSTNWTFKGGKRCAAVFPANGMQHAQGDAWSTLHGRGRVPQIVEQPRGVPTERRLFHASVHAHALGMLCRKGPARTRAGKPFWWGRHADPAGPAAGVQAHSLTRVCAPLPRSIPEHEAGYRGHRGIRPH